MGEQDRKTTEEIARLLSEQFAHDMMEQFHLDLDFSTRSIEKVEWIIENHLSTARAGSEERLAVMLGYYLGEVILRNLGGRWVKENDIPTLRDVGGRVSAVFPVTKAIKRLRNGAGESLVDYCAEIEKAHGAG
ncbi:MAG: hypothetical protein HYY93_01405 [Planctomycetes bacterium]|nr:hypothetical protein [Planctomycetota bacterium]